MAYSVLKYSIVDDEIMLVLEYYYQISETLGIRFEKEILSAFSRLILNPQHYSFIDKNSHRRINIEGFPYMLVYTIEREVVIVKMLFPQRDDPAKVWERLLVL